MADRKSKTGAPVKPRSSSAPRAAKSAKATPDKTAAETQRAAGAEASRLIDEHLKTLGDWRAEVLAEMRRLILETDPEIQEEWKWMGTPVWSRSGNICTGETYKQVVKLTFARGASLADPKGLFNSSLEGNTRRAIDIRKGETLNAKAFKALIQAAIAENVRAATDKSAPTSAPKATARKKAITVAADGKTVLLSGGNPQIAKAEGDAPVQAYIAAMPGWKQGVGQRLDELIVRAVPNVRKAVKWNSPFYGVEGQGWFLSFHVLTRYVKVTFFNGALLDPIPPGGTEKSKEARWIDLYEDGEFDEKQLIKWVKQAAAIPGWLS